MTDIVTESHCITMGPPLEATISQWNLNCQDHTLRITWTGGEKYLHVGSEVCVFDCNFSFSLLCVDIFNDFVEDASRILLENKTKSL